MFLLYRSRSYRVAAASPWFGSGIRWMAEPSFRPMGTETIPQASVFPQTAARYSRQISRRSTWPERREELSPFCHQEKAGRVFIQTVDCPEHEGFLFLSEIARQAVGQGIAVVSLGGVDGHSSGLVYHQEVCILIQDVQVHGNGLHSCGAPFFRNTYLELVSVLQHAGGKNGGPVHKKAAGSVS